MSTTTSLSDAAAAANGSFLLQRESDTAPREAENGSRALNDALITRATARNVRRKRELIYLGIVVGSVLLALGYGAVIVTPRYASQTQFAVRNAVDPKSVNQPLSGIIWSTSDRTGSTGTTDGYAVNDFLQSRDCLSRLVKKINLRALLLPNSAASASVDEELFRAYQKAVKVHFNVMEQTNVVKVEAFSPEDSQKIAAALYALSEEYVASMDDKGANDALVVTKQQLQEAEDRAKAAGVAISAWRNANGDVDPTADSGAALQRMNQLQQQLSLAQVNYEKIRAFGNPNHPLLRPAQLQVEELQRQVADAHAQLAGSGQSTAAKLSDFDQLKNAQTYADADLNAVRSTYEHAVSNTLNNHRYVMPIELPIAQNEPSEPKYSYLALEGLLVGIVLSFVTSIGFGLKNRFQP